MSLQASVFAQLDDLASRFAGESIFAQAGSDEGLIPCYSLLTEILPLAVAEPSIHGPVQALHARLDGLLNEASALNAPAVEHIKEIAGWLTGALGAVRE
ncbi:MAG: hypothetical protein RL376_1585, partial [Verrucomicrobiota bacterium]